MESISVSLAEGSATVSYDPSVTDPVTIAGDNDNDNDNDNDPSVTDPVTIAGEG